MIESPPYAEEAALLHRAHRQDEAAARRVVELLGPQVQRIIANHASLQGEAEDLLQEVFFQVFRHALKFRGEAPLLHWVSRIAKCRCLDRLRHYKARPETSWEALTPSQQAWLEATSTEAPTSTAGEDATALLEKLFATLAPLDAWLLREVELRERSLAEIAEEAEWSQTLTRVRLFRARGRLKKAYANLESEPVYASPTK